MKEKDLYLQEDQDLIDQLESVGPMSTGQAADQQKYKISSIQVKATLRGRKNMVDFDKSTTRYSKILGVFALIQIVVAILQLTLQAIDSTYKWLGFVFVLILAGALWYIMRVTDKDLND